MISDPLLFWKYATPSIFGTVIGNSFSIVSPVFPPLLPARGAMEKRMPLSFCFGIKRWKNMEIIST